MRITRIRGRLIVTPNNAAEPGAVEMPEFLAAFGVKDTPPATDPPGDTPPATDPPPVTDPPPATDPPGDTPPANAPPPANDPPDPAKAAAGQAFAQMRVENKKLNTMLKSVAEVLGVSNLEDPDKLQQVLQEKITKALADKQGVPPELLTRLQQLEERDKAYTQDQTRQAAYLGFQKVKTQFELDDVALNAFADQLISEGINPFEQEVNLVGAYVERNIKKLLQDAEAKGIQKEAERAANASAHSTTPPGKSNPPGTPGDPTKITSMNQLNGWFNSQGV